MATERVIVVTVEQRNGATGEVLRRHQIAVLREPIEGDIAVSVGVNEEETADFNNVYVGW